MTADQIAQKYGFSYETTFECLTMRERIMLEVAMDREGLSSVNGVKGVYEVLRHAHTYNPGRVITTRRRIKASQIYRPEPVAILDRDVEI